MHKESRGVVPASLVALMVSVSAGVLFGEVGSLQLDTGEQIYKTACVACHGSDARARQNLLRDLNLPIHSPTSPAVTRPPRNWTMITERSSFMEGNIADSRKSCHRLSRRLRPSRSIK